MTDHRHRRVARTTLSWLGRLVLLTLALGVAAAIVVVVVIPRMTQGAAMTVLTGSMSPEIPVGSVVLVRPVDPRTLEVGDVATYQVEPDQEVFITHRITEIHEAPKGLSFTFKGDANRGADLDQIPSDAVRGEVWFHVPYLGAVRDTLHGQGGITLVAMILLAGYAISQVGGGLRDRRRQESGVGGLTLPQTVLVVELRLAGDADAALLAREWGALLLDRDATTATLLIAPPQHGVAAALELLSSQDPVRVEVWEPGAVLSGRVRPQAMTTAAAQVDGHV